MPDRDRSYLHGSGSAAAGAEALGHTIKVETQGSVGAQNTLTEAEIAAANLVIIAADTKVDMSRFRGKPVYETSTNAAINDGQAVVKNALAQAASGPAGPDHGLDDGLRYGRPGQ